MNNLEVIQMFLKDSPGKSHTLESKEGKLYSYQIVIAKDLSNNTIAVSNMPHKLTTFKHLSKLKAEAIRQGFKFSTLDNQN